MPFDFWVQLKKLIFIYTAFHGKRLGCLRDDLSPVAFAPCGKFEPSGSIPNPIKECKFLSPEIIFAPPLPKIYGM